MVWLGVCLFHISMPPLSFLSFFSLSLPPSILPAFVFHCLLFCLLNIHMKLLMNERSVKRKSKSKNLSRFSKFLTRFCLAAIWFFPINTGYRRSATRCHGQCNLVICLGLIVKFKWFLYNINIKFTFLTNQLATNCKLRNHTGSDPVLKAVDVLLQIRIKSCLNLFLRLWMCVSSILGHLSAAAAGYS